MDVNIRKDLAPEYAVFKTAFLYCASIIVFPVLTFFLTKWIIFDGILSLSTVNSNVYSAVSSIIVLHISLGLFIYKACVPSPEKSTKAE